MGELDEVSLEPEKQWQCDCGLWISTAYHRHTHIKAKEVPLDTMIAAREMGMDATEAADLTHVLRGPQHPVRPKPL